MSTEQEISNEQLAARIKSGDDAAGNMARLYMRVRGFIRSMAWKYRGYAKVEDLEQEGVLALYSAVAGYDPSAGCLKGIKEAVPQPEAALFPPGGGREPGIQAWRGAGI